MLSNLLLLLTWLGGAWVGGQELVCLSSRLCIPWDAACQYVRNYCVNGTGSSCDGIPYLCQRVESPSWCSSGLMGSTSMNQEYQRCWSKDPLCEPQCEALEMPAHCYQDCKVCKARLFEPKACEASRCLCRKGYRRDAQGRCVPAHTCQHWKLVERRTKWWWARMRRRAEGGSGPKEGGGGLCCCCPRKKKAEKKAPSTETDPTKRPWEKEDPILPSTVYENSGLTETFTTKDTKDVTDKLHLQNQASASDRGSPCPSPSSNTPNTTEEEELSKVAADLKTQHSLPTTTNVRSHTTADTGLNSSPTGGPVPDDVSSLAPVSAPTLPSSSGAEPSSSVSTNRALHRDSESTSSHRSQ